MSHQTSLGRVMTALRARKNPRNVAGMARFGVNAKNALGISPVELRKMARALGRNHALAQQLWKTGVHEARMLAAFLAEPAKMTPKLMDEWVKDFESWDLCDTCCGSCFDRTPHAWKKAAAWAKRKEEYVRRAGFVLVASLAVHDKAEADAPFEAYFPTLERYADDERKYVRKAINWALRQIGKRNARLRKKAMAVARRISKIDAPSARWIASDALRELSARAA